jgi:uncharacterized protein YjbI with pentapeptide repeats
MKKKKLTLGNFLERVKKNESVSRLDFELDFKWTTEFSSRLKAILKNLSSANLSFADLSSANLSSANLSSANLSFADLSSAKGIFTYTYGVRLKVVVKED